MKRNTLQEVSNSSLPCVDRDITHACIERKHCDTMIDDQKYR